ncbi:hypothetical protein GPALN_006569, partial [Globodera pallida]
MPEIQIWNKKRQKKVKNKMIAMKKKEKKMIKSKLEQEEKTCQSMDLKVAMTKEM